MTITSFLVGLDSQNTLTSLSVVFNGGDHPGSVKRKNAKKGQGGAGAGDGEEED